MEVRKRLEQCLAGVDTSDFLPRLFDACFLPIALLMFSFVDNFGVFSSLAVSFCATDFVFIELDFVSIELESLSGSIRVQESTASRSSNLLILYHQLT